MIVEVITESWSQHLERGKRADNKAMKTRSTRCDNYVTCCSAEVQKETKGSMIRDCKMMLADKGSGSQASESRLVLSVVVKCLKDAFNVEHKGYQPLLP